jgi:predicted  nucleic acid-binding Zn-ribbon protein
MRERDALKRRFQLALGAETDSLTQSDLLHRIQELERQNQTLVRDLTKSNGRARTLAGQLEEVEETVASLGLALRKAMRAGP